ncbi:Ca2+-dependent phosphoinositide-specific phospholipase C [Novosphingobium album (ex Liu et al. 2023)]|uniref:Ca2+-dependent phosphoinositide-specific phospholipase C n=1 Tax=Novosphingobium album (ex Liu et al. 2023) TaxID=3031130 RepID=A0ABT5WPP2_9SPHN|nr:Ca2+-dependent phosphoinositide-specific phospholipase C [Novosphingobium album (ex Liu et al. 2023)]MDE8652025.1 Ca2+-dependent phosphoinositide-specific phospholipase C [Novosphingobium album (ex Liu et al. 2023)]
MKPTFARRLCALGLAMLAMPCLEAGAREAARMEAPQLPDSLPINRIQILGTHNSYSQGVDPHILRMIDQRLPSMHTFLDQMPEDARKEFLLAHPNDVTMSEGLNYRHPSLAAQLDLGVRGLEIDVNADPQGGAYADPAAYRLLRQQGVRDLLAFDPAPLTAPGLKVLHMADIDFRSSCPTFRVCLTQMKAWSDAHPRHVPIFIMIEAKVQATPLVPRDTPVPPFTPATYDEIDSTILDVIGRDRVVAPDDVRGTYPTLEQAVLAGNWPSLGQARGKFVFLLSTATGRDGASGYLTGHPGLKGRLAFLDSAPGRDYAAFILNDNALENGAEIRDQVARGYLVRSRADIETWEAKANDMTRANAAFASGAQIVSTDFEQPGNGYGTSYVVRLPGGDVARATTTSAK